MFVAVLVTKGAEIILTGGNDHRLAVGKALGAAHTLNYRSVPDLVAVVRNLAHGGLGADAVIECTGKPGVWESSVAMLRKGGVANLFGGCPKDTKFSVSTEDVHYNEIQVMGVFHSTPAHVRNALDWIAGQPGRLQPLISAQLPLSRLLEAFQLMDARKAFKVAIHPGE
jgi:L-iditol 2-dehydrogenase